MVGELVLVSEVNHFVVAVYFVQRLDPQAVPIYAIIGYFLIGASVVTKDTFSIENILSQTKVDGKLPLLLGLADFPDTNRNPGF
jgi:hypothetical protein